MMHILTMVSIILMFPYLQRWRSNRWLNLWLPEANFSLWTKWTPQQDSNQTMLLKTTNNTIQHSDDEITKKNTKEKSLYICVKIIYLNQKKREKKYAEGWFSVKKWCKTTPPRCVKEDNLKKSCSFSH